MLQETENGLWAESAEYIADRYYEETAGWYSDINRVVEESG